MDNALKSAWLPLRRRTFRLLWLAQLGSNVGMWMQTVGAQWFLVESSDSSALVAWVQTASLLPALLLSLLAGVLADQFDRRRLIIWSTMASTAVAALLAWMTHVEVLTPWSLLLMTFALGAAGALTAPAWQAIQPELVPREEIRAAAGLGSVTVNAARAVGPAIAGVLVGLSGPALVFALNALSFIGVVVAVAAWRRPPPDRPTEREVLTSAIGAGLRYMWSGPIIRRILLRCVLFAFPASALWALLPVVSSERFDVDSAGYGVMLGALGVGALAGIVLVPIVKERLSDNHVLAASALAFALTTVALATLPFWAALPLLVAGGVAWIASLTTLNAGLQLSLAAWVRARGMGAYLLVFMGSQAVGSFLWGALSASVGAVATLLSAAVALVLTAASVHWLPLRPQTGELDRTVVPTAVPTLVFEPAPTDGPILVVHSYRVGPDNAEAFLAAMTKVRASRRRTGGRNWHLYRNGADRDEFREEFVVASWSEFTRQANERWLASDQQSLSDARGMSTEAVSEAHYFEEHR